MVHTMWRVKAPDQDEGLHDYRSGVYQFLVDSSLPIDRLRNLHIIQYPIEIETGYYVLIVGRLHLGDKGP